MKKRFQLLLLFAAKSLGFFAISRWLTRGGLRILCYHGASLEDENLFRGGLFISPERFERRMGYLKRKRYPVIPLQEAINGLDGGKLPQCATVITIDDGWIGTALCMTPVLSSYNFPATLYLATYYAEKQTQVFNVALDYALWKSKTQSLDLNAIDPKLQKTLRLDRAQDREAVCDAVIELAEKMTSAAERQALLGNVCGEIGVDFTTIVQQRLFSFMSMQEAKSVVSQGIDLQLHTHRHRFSAADEVEAQREIEDNRLSLSTAVSGPRRHFCFPSGEYELHQLEWLTKWGIDSATTTEAGFNFRGANKLQLRRFLDSERISDIEFDAEMSGFFEIMRKLGYAV